MLALSVEGALPTGAEGIGGKGRWDLPADVMQAPPVECLGKQSGGMESLQTPMVACTALATDGVTKSWDARRFSVYCLLWQCYVDGVVAELGCFLNLAAVVSAVYFHHKRFREETKHRQWTPGCGIGVGLAASLSVAAEVWRWYQPYFSLLGAWSGPSEA